MNITYAENLKFTPTGKPPVFSTFGALLSILSLFFMSGLATWMLCQLCDEKFASWAWLPFAFTIFGSGLGAIFELVLLLKGQAFQQGNTKFRRFIVSIRLMNLGPVVATIFFAIAAMTIEDAALRTALLYVSAALGTGLAFTLFYGGVEKAAPEAPLILLSVQVLQIVLVLCFGSALGWEIQALLIGQAVLQLFSLLTTTATPLKSTIFHVSSTLSGLLLYWAMIQKGAAFSHEVAIALPQGSLLLWGFIAACIVGVVVACVLFPKVYNSWRNSFSDAIWSFLYFLLISAPRFPRPVNLSKVYNRHTPQQTRLEPYSIVHPEHMSTALNIPAAENIEQEVLDITLQESDGKVQNAVQTATKTFQLIELLDHYFPQANVNTRLKNKLRMPMNSDGSEYWPALFKRKLFGHTMPDGGQLEKIPELAKTRFLEGQLIAYLAESGVASPFLQCADEARGQNALMLDFSYLEKYETKPDYEPYGGKAFFEKVKDDSREEPYLKLVSVIAPHSDQELVADVTNPEFRHTERLLLASIYYQVISGKHLAEIHMTYNLVEVAMHNAFEYEKQWKHGFRTFLYLHLFSHELAEEITTEHLVQDGAVFTQIFATTHTAMVQHLNDTYARFEFGTDENFELRAELMEFVAEDGSTEALPNACIHWEKEYAAIWTRYASKIIDAIYVDDAAVADDQYLQIFYQNLKAILPQGLPARYAAFQTKAGIVRFSVDLIHHCVIRHQVYGTTGIRAALDPRISMVQVPRDGGSYAIDEWRSLAYVATATGKSRFTLLLGSSFKNLLDDVTPGNITEMSEAFDQLQHDLEHLDVQWQQDPERNKNYFRALPSALHTGPGY